MKKKIFLRAVLFVLAGNMVFAAGENKKIDTSQKIEVIESEVQQKIGNIEGKAEVEVKSSRRSKLNRFISKVTGKSWKMVWNDEFNGNQHLPNHQQLKQSGDLKSQLLVILTIGMRPCSGAIFVLFLAYMLDLYWWGILATFAMSLGTGLMLSLFAALVRYARNVAIRLGHWYGLAGSNQKGEEAMIKCIAGAIMIFFALSLLYSTMEAVTGGAALFGG